MRTTLLRREPNVKTINAIQMMATLAEQRAISTRQLMKSLGVTPGQFQRLAKGRRDLNVGQFASVARLFDMPTADLYEYAYVEEV